MENPTEPAGALARLDGFAVAISTLCLLHCLALPVALTLLPALGTTWLADERLHLWLLLFVLPSSSVALGLGCRRHRSIAVAGRGAAGLTLLAATALLVGPAWGEAAERILTAVAACLVASAHVGNYRLCRRAACTHDADHD